MIRLVSWNRHAAAELVGAAGSLDTLGEIGREVQAGLAHLWRVDNDQAQGWVVTRVEIRPDQSLELVIVLGAGTGARPVLPYLVRLARDHQIPRIRTHVKRRALVRLYERQGFRLDHQWHGHFVMVWTDGQQKQQQRINEKHGV